LQQSRCRSDRSPMQRRSGWPTSPCFAAEILGSPCVTMTSTLSLTNSATTSVARSLRPSPQRYAIAMVRPSIRSNSCRRCTKAAVHGPAAEAVPAGGFVQWNNPVLRRWLVLAYVEPANLCVEAGAFMAFHAARSGETRMDHETWLIYFQDASAGAEMDRRQRRIREVAGARLLDHVRS
jgi:hypothetical protein